MLEEAESITSWGELNRLVEDYYDKSWIFRGVENSEYKLTPKIGRDGARKDPTTGASLLYDEMQERKMFESFILEASSYYPYLPETSLLKWAAIAQHHGMPTRLLDWTESPLVAAYFAVKGAGLIGGRRVDAAMYGIARPPIASEEEFFSVNHCLKLVKPAHLNPRITVQRGVFTLHNPPTQEFCFEPVKKWVIPSTLCFRIKLMLDSCAINEASLFPDVSGLAQHVGWRYKWGRIS